MRPATVIITFKTPDALDDAVADVVSSEAFARTFSCSGNEEDFREGRTHELRSILGPYVRYGEIVSVEFKVAEDCSVKARVV